jgi:hypothetical protein
MHASGWFDNIHAFGNFVWTAPPAAAEVVVEHIGLARLKRLSAMHIILVPRLMIGCWQRQLNWGRDGYSRLDDEKVWDLSCHF